MVRSSLRGAGAAGRERAGRRTYAAARTLPIVAAIVVALAGCGGDDPRFTSQGVADMMNPNVQANLAREFPDATADPLECVRDGDDTHFRCITTVRRGEETVTVTASVVCDEQTGRCISVAS